MSANGAPLANGRQLPVGSASEPLLVPSADVTAKNLRASLHNRTASGTYDSDGRMQRRAMSILDKVVGPNTVENVDKDAPPKFTRLVDDTPSMLTQLKSFIYRVRTSGKSGKKAAKKSASGETNPVYRALGKLCDVIEYSPLPPMVYFLGVLFLIIVLKLFEPVRLLKKFPYIPQLLEVLLVLSGVIAILWKRSRVFYTLAKGDSPYKHPIDSCLEPYHEHITERAERIKLENAELAENHAQLDALRKELAKDPAAHIPGSVLKPSRKAANMIRDGALGAGYDAEKAAEAEEMRKRERQRESHKLWREKSVSVGNDDAEMVEKLIISHAATGYRKHTKELKMRAAPRPPPAVNAFKKASAAVVGASSAASAFAGLTAGGGNSSGSPSGENSASQRDQSGSSGRRDGSGSGASGIAGTAAGGGDAVRGNSFNVFGNVIHPNNMDMTRRSSGGSDMSVKTAASGPANAAVSRQNSKRFKKLFRRKRSNYNANPTGGGGVALRTTASAPLPADVMTTPITFTVPLNGNRVTPIAMTENTLPDSHSAVLGENVRHNVNGSNAGSNAGSRKNSKTYSRLPSFSRLSAKRRSKTVNLNRQPDR